MLRKLKLTFSRMRNKDESGEAFLEKKYLSILKHSYGVKPEAVSNEKGPAHPLFASALEAQEHIFDNAEAGKIYNGFWRRLLGDLLEAVPKESGLHDASLFIGQVPNPRFNAEVQDYGRGRYLILVQSGFELFLYRFSMAMVGSMRLRFRYGGEETVVEPQIDMDTARAIVSRNMDLLFRGRHEMPLVLHSEPALGLATAYQYALLQFVLAHEIGHIMQSVKPYTDGSLTAKKPPLKDVSNLKDPWNKEVVADTLGDRICRRLVPVAARKHLAEEVADKVLFEAPYILFSLLEALDRIAAKNGINHWQTHPPAELRKKKLLSVQILEGMPQIYQDMAEEKCKQVRLLTGLA